MRIGKIKVNHYINYAVIGLLTLIMGIVSLVGVRIDNSLLFLMEKVAMSIILAVSLSLVVGFLGELSLGHAGFMCVGAYLGGKVAALLMPVLGNSILTFLVSLLAGCGAAALCGVIIGIPALRLRGDYLAIVTLAFGEIVKSLFQNTSDESFGGTLGLETPRFDKQYLFIIAFALVLITLAVYVIFFIVLRWTKFGRRIYAVGSNPEAAVVSGIRIDRIKIAVYTMMGAICGLCGSMYVSYYASSQNNMATGIEMDVIASCVVGGVSLSGGRGSVIGVLLGSLTIAIISKSLSLVGINPFWQQALKGAIILVAVVINATAQRNMDKRALAKREV